jgi:hypothetical protein
MHRLVSLPMAYADLPENSISAVPDGVTAKYLSAMAGAAHTNSADAIR